MSENNARMFSRGMSLRDWFAGMAMSGDYPASVGNPRTANNFAKEAYRLADAMLVERNKPLQG